MKIAHHTPKNKAMESNANLIHVLKKNTFFRMVVVRNVMHLLFPTLNKKVVFAKNALRNLEIGLSLTNKVVTASNAIRSKELNKMD